jgi:hypothetical protein
VSRQDDKADTGQAEVALEYMLERVGDVDTRKSIYPYAYQLRIVRGNPTRPCGYRRCLPVEEVEHREKLANAAKTLLHALTGAAWKLAAPGVQLVRPPRR